MNGDAEHEIDGEHMVRNWASFEILVFVIEPMPPRGKYGQYRPVYRVLVQDGVQPGLKYKRQDRATLRKLKLLQK